MQTRPHAPCRRVLLAAIGTLLLCVVPAHADDEPPDETQRWVPSFSARSGVTASVMTGKVDTWVVKHYDDDAVPPIPPGTTNSIAPLIPVADRTPSRTITFYEFAGFDIFGNDIFSKVVEPLVTPTESNSVVMNPWVGGSVELMSPGLQSLPTRPRFFVHGDIQYVFGTPRSLARDDVPNGPPEIGLPPGFLLQYDQSLAPLDDQPGIPPDGVTYPYPVTGTLTFPVQAGVPYAPDSLVSGQGTKVEVSEHPWVWGLGGGVAFTFELFERRLRVKPSVEYQKRKLTIQTVANRALPSNTQGELRAPAQPDIEPVFNIVQLSSTDELDIHGLGPGLEVEMDTYQVGPVMLSLYISGQAYRVLGDTQVTAAGDVTVPCGVNDGSNLALLCQQTRDFDGQFAGIDISRQRFPNNETLSGLGVNDVYADFDFEINPWSVQAGVGLRVRGVPDYWVPKSVAEWEMPSMAAPSWLPW